MNSKLLLALCLIGFVALISATETPKTKNLDEGVAPEAEAAAEPEDSDAPQSRVRRQWGYGMGYPMMGMYRPYGMMGMYRPYGMMGGYGMYRPWGMGYGMYG